MRESLKENLWKIWETISKLITKEEIKIREVKGMTGGIKRSAIILALIQGKQPKRKWRLFK